MLLDIDIETYSGADLSKCGVYRYSEDKDFRLLLFSYSIDDDPVAVVDVERGETIPDAVLDMLTDTTATKWAHNAQFERVCLSRWLKRTHPDRLADDFLNPEGWKCSMVLSASLGLPLSLKAAGEVLKLKDQKMATEGDKLIRYFCQKSGTRRNTPDDFPAKWDLFKEYNVRDVEVEKQIRDKLLKYTDIDWNEYWTDQRINDRGVCLDKPFVAAALAVDKKSTTELTENLKNLTDISKPNSVNQLKDWLSDNGLEIDSLSKKEVAQALETDLPEEIENVLRLRQQIAKSSIKKYKAMENSVCSDGRARGMFQFFGAGRTGRWAGRLIQLHNLPQNHLPDLEQARNLVRSKNYEALSLLYDSIPNVLSELVRTAFIPQPGHKFIVADFSAIEARVLAWLARESWREKVFEQNGDIYCASASKMFGVPVEKHGQNKHLRQKGKVAELALGFGGSSGALIAMGALEMGLHEEELPDLVKTWRDTNPHVTGFWWNVDAAAVGTVRTGESSEVKAGAVIKFEKEKGILFVTLPSGRRLSYIRPRIEANQFGGDCITYEGFGKTKKWERIETYGPKLVENIIQATSRDLLAYAITQFSKRGYNLVMHVHDEIVIEADERLSVDEVSAQMRIAPPWARGLKLNAAGFETKFYRKD